MICKSKQISYSLNLTDVKTDERMSAGIEFGVCLTIFRSSIYLDSAFSFKNIVNHSVGLVDRGKNGSRRHIWRHWLWIVRIIFEWRGTERKNKTKKSNSNNTTIYMRPSTQRWSKKELNTFVIGISCVMLLNNQHAIQIRNIRIYFFVSIFFSLIPNEFNILNLWFEVWMLCKPLICIWIRTLYTILLHFPCNVHQTSNYFLCYWVHNHVRGLQMRNSFHEFKSKEEKRREI